MTDDARFRGRVVRLTAVSALALGVLTVLVVATLTAPPVLVGAFVVGWVLMPATLAASLGHPRLRYALLVPATFVTTGLLAVVLGWRPLETVAAAGWVLMLAGVALGGGLGLWFWYRLLPVPAALDDPFGRGRWSLVAVHIALVVGGAVLAATALA